jgi:cyanuric acid amidohydrolase
VQIDAIKLTTSGPADVTGLRQLIDNGELTAAELLCIIGKTEGNGGRNDFTRDLAMTAFEELFSEVLGISKEEVVNRVIFSLSGGCEGAVSPHIIAFSQKGKLLEKPQTEKRLAIAIGYTRPFQAEEIGRLPQIIETARVIKELSESLKIDSTQDVHLVQMKGAIPKYTYDQGRQALTTGRPIRSDMVYSRGASALACALAAGEVELSDLNDEMICQDFTKFSSTASCSAKPGLERTEIMVMANSRYATGNLQIQSSILEDMLDTRAVHKVLNKLGFEINIQLTPEQREKIVGVFAKSEADPSGKIRGRRHTMLSDDDISDTRYSRCLLSSVIAGVLGDTTIYVSTRAEHHGPSGGGTLAIIARVEEETL